MTPRTVEPLTAITQVPSTIGSSSVAANASPLWTLAVDSVLVVLT